MNRLRHFTPARRWMVSLPVVIAACFSLSVMADEPESAQDAIKAATSVINQAEESRVTSYASPELHSAHEKLAAARELSQRSDDKSVRKSRWLADEARSDAEYAIAKAKLARAETVNKEMQRNIDLLQQSMQPK